VPKIEVLPQPAFCPNGAVVDAAAGETIDRALRDHDVEIDRACGGVCACTSCHVVVRDGYSSLNSIGDREQAMLDMAWGLEATSRLSCQACAGSADLVVEIPLYNSSTKPVGL
jgi:2Fe-2S ferredoxin